MAGPELPLHSSGVLPQVPSSLRHRHGPAARLARLGAGYEGSRARHDPRHVGPARPYSSRAGAMRRHVEVPVNVPDPAQLHPTTRPDLTNVVFLRNQVRSDLIDVGDFTYYDDEGHRG